MTEDINQTTPRRGDPAYVRGVALTLGISVLWSTSPLFYRAIQDTPPLEAVFYRSLFLTLGVSFFVALRYRSTFLSGVRAIGMPGAVAALSLVLSAMCFIAAVRHTTIANISFTFGTTPLFAALLGWVALRERVSLGTWIAMAIAAGGVAIMVLDGFAAGTLHGNLLALAAAITGAGYAVALRFGRYVDQVPAIMVSGIFGMALSAPFVLDFRIPWFDLSLCAIQGLLISGFCNSLYTVCARLVPVVELTLLSLIEIMLSPLGAWIVFAEVPSGRTLLGGGVLLAAVFGHAIVSTRPK